MVHYQMSMIHAWAESINDSDKEIQIAPTDQ